MMAFKKTQEDFICDRCLALVTGDGYTNHCPKCLWGKHVDIDPGDRAAQCGGMMRPIALEGATGRGYVILHRCEACAFERRNKVEDNDDEKSLLILAQGRAGV